MNLRPVLATALLGLWALPASAEVYMGLITPMTLGEIRTKFPGASLRNVPAAWVKEGEALYSLTGAGIAGTIMLKLTDYRPTYKKDLLELPATEENAQRIQEYQTEIDKSDDGSLFIGIWDWVRWIPDSPLPVQRLITRFGKADKKGFDANDFKPYLFWSGRRITANLTDDEKQAMFIDFQFTELEANSGYVGHGFPKPFPGTVSSPASQKKTKKMITAQ